MAVFAQGQTNVFKHREGLKQAPVLKHDTTSLAQGQGLVVGKIFQIEAEHAQGACAGALQQDHFAQQRRFAGTTAADQGKYFAMAYLQRDVGMNDMLAKAGCQLADLDDRLSGLQLRLHVRGPAH